jgi:hypothetical protein
MIYLPEALVSDKTILPLFVPYVNNESEVGCGFIQLIFYFTSSILFYFCKSAIR